MARSDYSAKIVESSAELTAKEKLSLMDFKNCVQLDEVTGGDKKVVITPAKYAIIEVHNEKSDNKDYSKIVIVDENGTKYISGSVSLIDSFRDINDVMSGEDEKYSIEVYKLESKNYKGKGFITCSIA